MVSQSEHSLRMSCSCHWLKTYTMLVSDGGSLVTKSCLTLATQWTVACQDFLGKKIEVGCHFLLQGILPTQGSKLHAHLHPCRRSPTLQTILYWLSHQTHKILCPSCSVGDWLHNKIPVFPLSLKSTFLGLKQCHVLLDMCSWMGTRKVSKAFSKFRDGTRNTIGSESKSKSKGCDYCIGLAKKFIWVFP